MSQRGFTIIELMIVVAILGILASYAMPSFQNQIVRAQITEGLQLATPMQELIAGAYASGGRLPADNTAAGLPAPDKLIGNYVTSITVADGALHIEFGNYIHKLASGKVLTLRPQTVEGSPASPMSWQCGYREPPEGLVASGDNRTDIPAYFLPLHCL